MTPRRGGRVKEGALRRCRNVDRGAEQGSSSEVPLGVLEAGGGEALLHGPGDDGLVCMWEACKRGHTDVVEALLAAGRTEPKYHAWSRPRMIEREATHRAIALAELVDQPIQIFHVSCSEVADEIARARHRGLKVWGETCPQYLFFTEDDLARPDGAKWVCSPPMRTAADQARRQFLKAAGRYAREHVRSIHDIGPSAECAMATAWAVARAAADSGSPRAAAAAFDAAAKACPELLQCPEFFQERSRWEHIPLNDAPGLAASVRAALRLDPAAGGAWARWALLRRPIH